MVPLQGEPAAKLTEGLKIPSFKKTSKTKKSWL